MYLNVVLDKFEYYETINKIKKINEYITLYIFDGIGYIENGLIERENTYYFGKTDIFEDNYQLISLHVKGEYISINKYPKYLSVANKFREQWSEILKINYTGKKNK